MTRQILKENLADYKGMTKDILLQEVKNKVIY